MQRPLISVITAVRNGEKYIAETIASIQSQDVTDWEYLIVDDASTDSTADIVREAMKEDSRLQLLQRKQAGGPYVAANDAVRLCTGEYVMRTDGDDLQPPDRFRLQLDFLSTGQYRGCVTYWQAWGQGLIPGTVASVPQPKALCWYLLLRGASVHSSLAVQRTALVELGGYRELRLSQDYRLLCEMTRRGWLGVMPVVLSYVRQHENRSTNRHGDLQRMLALEIASEHWLEMMKAPITAQELEALWAVGYSLPFPVRRGLEMLKRWDQHWMRDKGLEAADFKELSELSAMRRRKFLRANLKLRPWETAWAAAKFGFSWNPQAEQPRVAL